LSALVLPGWPPGFLLPGWDPSGEAFVPADMINAPFVVGARVNRTKVLFTIEHNITRGIFNPLKAAKSGVFLPQAATVAGSW
jgi:hypothetical protein